MVRRNVFSFLAVGIFFFENGCAPPGSGPGPADGGDAGAGADAGPVADAGPDADAGAVADAGPVADAGADAGTDAGPSGPPTISGFNPTSGYLNAAVVITGANFTGATQVRFGSNSATYTIDGPTQITARVPLNGQTGQVNIEVQAPSGAFTSLTPFTILESYGVWREDVDASYASADAGLTGNFQSGQNADIMLSGIDFNQTGGPLLFNHPGTCASDGTRLFLADRNNNRILVWSTIPTANTPPDYVLGQPDLTSNNPGTGLNQLNWPVSVSVGGGKLVVADTENNRLLLWDSIPTDGGQAANRSIQITEWPWGVWTNGTKLAATATRGAKLHVWDSFPTMTNQAATHTITGNGMGTPRTITSNGTYVIVGDHNAVTDAGEGQMNFFWTSWPDADDAGPTFSRRPVGDTNYGWMQGEITADNKLVMIGRSLFIWDSLPTNATQEPNLIVGTGGTGNPSTFYDFTGGDGSGLCFAAGRLFVSLSNGNLFAAYNALPTDAGQKPDFAVGAPDLTTNTLNANYFITNPNPTTDGVSLFASSDFDRAVYVWKKIPNQSGARPDYVFHTPMAPWDSVAYGGKLLVAGGDQILVWNTLPTNGAYPDRNFQGTIGIASLNGVNGVSWDGTYFAVANGMAGKIWVWTGIPDAGSNPTFVWETPGQQPNRLSSNGTRLVTAITNNQRVAVFTLTDPDAGARYVQGGPGMQPFNLPESALLRGSTLIVADTGFHRVRVWNDVETAIDGGESNIVLGETTLSDYVPEIGINKVFWPATLDFDGDYLWVGEYKFSGRLVRYSIRP
ncbi:MAG: IPT/TIG domain-containing protein [Deltaproteobacteria bacterium]|nr:IPT/TIG domain-containing protein [Deltaproteobacteria bacterium]